MEGENVFGNKIKVELAKKSPQTTDKQGILCLMHILFHSTPQYE